MTLLETEYKHVSAYGSDAEASFEEWLTYA